MPRKESKIVMSGDTLYVDLLHGNWAEISTESMEVVRGFAWRLDSYGYACRHRRVSDGQGPKTIYMHREVFEHSTGREIDPNLTVDHKDRDKLNNRIENLREVNWHQQGFNKDLQSNNTSGFRGVSWAKREGKWQAYYRLAGKKKHLGYFENFEDAVEARKEFDRSNHQQIQEEEVS